MLKYKKIGISILICMFSILFQSVNVNALNVPVTGTFSNISILRDDISDRPWVDPGDDPGETDENGECNVGDIECFEKKKEDAITTSDFLSQAIYSLDENIRVKETTENYIVNFNNSSITAMTKGFSLFDGSSIVMFFINILTLVLEMIGLLVSFITLISYNFASSSMIITTVRDAFTSIEKVIFDWSNPNSWIIKIIVISAVLSIIYKLISNFKKNLMPKQMIAIVLSVFMSAVAIVGVGIYGRPLLTATEESLSTMIVQTFSFDSTVKDPEIANKRTIFETMQLQPFMLRHFGTTSYEVIANMHEGSTVEDAKKRVQALLSAPTQDNAKKEKTVYGNKFISQSIGTSSQVLLLSAITVVHRTLMGIIIIILCNVAMCIKLLKELLIAMSVYQLIYWLFKRSHGALMWFSNRIMWCLISIVTDIGLSVALYFIFNTCASIATTNTLFLIVFDIIILVLLVLLFKNFSSIMAKIKKPVEDTVMGILSGDAPGDVYHQLRHNNGANKISNNMDDEATLDSDSSLSDIDSGSSDLSDVDANNLGDTDTSDPSNDLSDDKITTDVDSSSDSDINKNNTNKTSDDVSSVDDSTVTAKDTIDTKEENGNSDNTEIKDEHLKENEHEALEDNLQAAITSDDVEVEEVSEADDVESESEEVSEADGENNLADEYNSLDATDQLSNELEDSEEEETTLVDQAISEESPEPEDKLIDENPVVQNDLAEQEYLSNDNESTSDDSDDNDMHDDIHNEIQDDDSNIAEVNISDSSPLNNESTKSVVEADDPSIDADADYLDEELPNENNS